MSPLPQSVTTFPSQLTRRTSTACTSSDDEACGSHRTTILIIIFFGTVVAIILSLAYCRSRQRGFAKQRAAVEHRSLRSQIVQNQRAMAADVLRGGVKEERLEGRWEEAPPPYVREPQRVVVAGG